MPVQGNAPSTVDAVIVGAGFSGLYLYIGGVGRYRRICEDIVAEGYRGFRFEAQWDATAAAE